MLRYVAERRASVTLYDWGIASRVRGPGTERSQRADICQRRAAKMLIGWAAGSKLRISAACRTYRNTHGLARSDPCRDGHPLMLPGEAAQTASQGLGRRGAYREAENAPVACLPEFDRTATRVVKSPTAQFACGRLATLTCQITSKHYNSAVSRSGVTASMRSI